MYYGPERKKMRLSGYDYSQDGYYFVTICTKNRENFFGEIIDGKMILNEYGEIVKKEILQSENIRQEIEIDEYIIMPNHIHLLIEIIPVGCDGIAPGKNILNNGGLDDEIPVGCDGIAPGNGVLNNDILDKIKRIHNGTMPSFPTLSGMIRGLKCIVTKQIRENFEDYNFGWQKSFFDSIIRNEEQFLKTKQYIIDNPIKWEFDKNNLINI